MAENINIHANSTVVVTDVLRATTSMAVAFHRGADTIVPVKTLQEAAKYQEQGFMVAAERGGKKVDFADYGNSPLELLAADLKGKKLAFTTTNGTRAIHTAKALGNKVIIGAFVNLHAIAAELQKNPNHTLILCSGWNGTFCIEDTLFAGALAVQLVNSGKYNLPDDAAMAAVSLWYNAEPDPLSFVAGAGHVKRLRALGAHEDIQYAFRQIALDILPVVQGDEIQNLLHVS